MSRNISEEIKILSKEELLSKALGDTGKWQSIMTILVSLTRYLTTWNMMAYMILTPSTVFYCVEFLDNSTASEIQESKCYDNCVKYEYDRTVFESTLTTEFNLICDRAWLASFAQTVFMLGVLFGNGIVGLISDRFGRRKATIGCTFIAVALTFASSFVPHYWVFVTIRFIVGFACGGLLLTAYVMVVEINPRYRLEATCVSTNLNFSLGLATVAIFGYFLRNWNMFLLGISIVSLIFPLYILMVDETPRWLLSVGKTDQGLVLMEKIAKWNKRPVSDIAIAVKQIENCIDNEEQQNNSYMDLFRTKTMAILSFASTLVWVVVNTCYYGITQYTTSLGSNVFLIIAVSGLIQVLAIPAFYLSSQYLNVGRKFCMIFSFLLTSLLMLIIVFLDKDHWFTSVLSLTGSFVTSYSSYVSYLYSAELFPTTLRNTGMGLNSVGSRVGAMVAPFIATSSIQWTPAVIFTILPIIGALAIVMLPETKNKSLTDTVKEMK